MLLLKTALWIISKLKENKTEKEALFILHASLLSCIFHIGIFLFLFVFNIYNFENDACACGPPITVGRTEAWKKVGETNVSNFYFFLLYL